MLCHSRVQPSLLGEEHRLDMREQQNSSLLWNFQEYYEHPPYPLENFILARKCVKVKVNTPNTRLSALYVTPIYSRLIITSEDMY